MRLPWNVKVFLEDWKFCYPRYLFIVTLFEIRHVALKPADLTVLNYKTRKERLTAVECSCFELLPLVRLGGATPILLFAQLAPINTGAHFANLKWMKMGVKFEHMSWD